MALIPGYDFDIFISYAHIDNTTLKGKDDGWIKLFYEELKLLLERRFGRPDKIKFWWDSRKLDGSVVFDNSIESGINKAAIMICLNSPGYVASDYCKRELDTFFKKAQSEKIGLRVGERSRILNVLLNNIPFKEWPTELSGTSGFPFHDAKESDDYGDPVEFGTTEFKEHMKQLRDAVFKILTDFEQEQTKGTPQQSVVSVVPKDAFAVYMGEVADTLRIPRKRVISELEKNGFTVLAGVPPPDESSAHERAAKEALQNANLTIHLLDEYPGREISGASDIWYPQKQAEIALESGKPQIFWMPAETDFNNIEDEKYKLFLQSLEVGKTASKGYEFVRGSKSTLEKEILDFANDLKSKKIQKKPEPGKFSVLLDTHYNDQKYASDLYNALLQNQITTFINPQEDDPRKNLNLLGERMSQVKKLIFLYGSVSKEWVTERMKAAMQLIMDNEYPVEDFYIYMAPPHKESKDVSVVQRVYKIRVVDSSDNADIDQSIMKNFLTDIKTNAA